MNQDNSGRQELPPPGKEKSKHKRGTRKSDHKGLRVRAAARVAGWEIPCRQWPPDDGGAPEWAA